MRVQPVAACWPQPRAMAGCTGAGPTARTWYGQCQQPLGEGPRKARPGARAVNKAGAAWPFTGLRRSLLAPRGRAGGHGTPPPPGQTRAAGASGEALYAASVKPSDVGASGKTTYLYTAPSSLAASTLSSPRAANSNPPPARRWSIHLCAWCISTSCQGLEASALSGPTPSKTDQRYLKIHLTTGRAKHINALSWIAQAAAISSAQAIMFWPACQLVTVRPLEGWILLAYCCPSFI